MFSWIDKLTRSDNYDYDEFGPLPKKYAHDITTELSMFHIHNDLPKENILCSLYTGIIKYLHEHEGFQGKSTHAMIKGMEYPKNSSVKRAAQLRDFLLHYPIENSKADLINNVCFLYAGQQEFPHGLGNSRYLRNAICEALAPEFDSLYQTHIYKIPLLSHQSAAHKRIEETILSLGKPIQSMQSKFNKLALCMALFKNLRILPSELTHLILSTLIESTLASDKNTSSNLKSLPGFFRPRPIKPIELVHIEHENNKIGEFVMLS